MGNPSTWAVTRGLKQRFRISQISRRMKETLISGEILLSLKCCTVHTSRRLGYIVLATGGLNPAISSLEDNILCQTHHYISSLLLAAAIAAPTPIMADLRPQRRRHPHLSLRSGHRDYHNWADHEDRARRHYLEAQYRSYLWCTWRHVGVSHEDLRAVQYCNS